MASASRGWSWFGVAALAGVLTLGCTDETPTPPPDAAASPPRDGGADAARSGDAGDAAGASSDGAANAAEVTSAPSGPGCFAGRPRTHEELLNACWAETVTVIVAKPVKLPGGYVVGTPLPPLP
jgi:hypothetical protein